MRNISRGEQFGCRRETFLFLLLLLLLLLLNSMLTYLIQNTIAELLKEITYKQEIITSCSCRPSIISSHSASLRILWLTLDILSLSSLCFLSSGNCFSKNSLSFKSFALIKKKKRVALLVKNFKEREIF